jgi:hypothetical protein
MSIIRINSSEKSLKSFGWKILMGPAGVIDGIVGTLTLGYISTLLKLKVSLYLSRSRMEW